MNYIISRHRRIGVEEHLIREGGLIFLFIKFGAGGDWNVQDEDDGVG